MKKVMMMVAVLALSGTVMATNLKWGMNSGQALNSTTFADGSVMYLVWDSGANGLSSTFTITAGSANVTSFSIGQITDSSVSSGTLASGTYTQSTGTTITPTTLGTTAGTKSFYLVVISSDSKTLAYSSVKTANIQTSALSASSFWNSSDFTTVTAVPEASSMALISLGVAALGLRRKNRK